MLSPMQQGLVRLPAQARLWLPLYAAIAVMTALGTEYRLDYACLSYVIGQLTLLLDAFQWRTGRRGFHFAGRLVAVVFHCSWFALVLDRDAVLVVHGIAVTMTGTWLSLLIFQRIIFRLVGIDDR